MSRLDNLLSCESGVRFKSTSHVPFPWVSADKFMHNQLHFYVHYADDIKTLNQDKIRDTVFSFMSCEPFL